MERERFPSPRAPKPEEVKPVKGSDRDVPAGREFLWRIELLGVPGTLEGLSHVVSDGVFRRKRRETIKLGGQHQQHFC